MASRAEIVIRVTSSRGASKIEYTTKGRYVSFTTAGLTNTLSRQPIQPTATLPGFWENVLGIVTADIEAGS